MAKVEISEPTVSFRPITLTVENEAEAKVLFHLLNMKISANASNYTDGDTSKLENVMEKGHKGAMFRQFNEALRTVGLNLSKSDVQYNYEDDDNDDDDESW